MNMQLDMMRKRESRVWGRNSREQSGEKNRKMFVKYNLSRNIGSHRVEFPHLAIAFIYYL
jgi:hypothetical protein